MLDYLPQETLVSSMGEYNRNHVHRFLVTLFGEDVTANLAKAYRLGTSKKWLGANIFWQIDVRGNIRQAKITLYNPTTGQLDKDGEYVTLLVGKNILGNSSANLQQCFFGEHLLGLYPHRRVIIVDSEKTAMISSVYFPQHIWLAIGGSDGCRWTNPAVCKVLEHREVILFPDLGYYDKWQGKAEQVRSLVSCKLVVSDLLEKNCHSAERAAGWNLADYLLKDRSPAGLALTTAGYPLMWDRKAELFI